MLNKPRILVGTANFGSAYGIKKNTHNIVDMSAVAQTFTELGISGLDTSSDYLDAESIIGSSFENNLNLKGQKFTIEKPSLLNISNIIFYYGSNRA